MKIGSVARSHWTQGMWQFERSRENSRLRVDESERMHSERQVLRTLREFA